MSKRAPSFAEMEAAIENGECVGHYIIRPFDKKETIWRWGDGAYGGSVYVAPARVDDAIRLRTATALLREIANGPVPAHGSLDVYQRIAEFLRETDNA